MILTSRVADEVAHQRRWHDGDSRTVRQVFDEDRVCFAKTTSVGEFAEQSSGRFLV